MSEHNLILEFYKPTYNLDFDYDGDGGLDLHFTNIKGEFFMTMNDSYNSVYIEDEDCEFSKGEMFATVDLGDLVERIINGEFRQTNGKAVSDWGKRFIGDGEEQIEFNGKNYADGSLFWDDFFKEMPKDEIKDFMTFCEDYLDLPNIEVDTVSDKYDFENGKVELKSNDKWGIGISDDYNIISVDEFTCDSEDAFVAYDVASSESNEDDFYESKKSARKSLKERYEYKVDEITDIIRSNNDGLNDSCNILDEYVFDIERGKIDWLSKNAYDEISIAYANCIQYLRDEYDGKKKDELIDDLTKFFDKVISLTESKKSFKKSLKESTKWVYDVADELMISFEDILDIFEEYGYGKKEAKNFYDSKWNDVTDAFNEMAELAVLFELEDWTESKKSSKKSLKESTDECFSLYDFNKHDPFVKEWIRNINKEFKDVSIESIGDDEIIFRVWFDESMGLDVFDDIATDCMPRTLIEFMSDMNIDFGYQFVYEDDKFAENDYVFIRFVAW